MSAFEYFFTFFGLMMGMALVNVAGGFGRLWRARSAGALGWCIPLLAILILVSVISSWVGIWATLQEVEIGAASLGFAAAMALPYALVSTLMFPEDAAEWPDLDAYYLQHSRVILVILALSPLAVLTAVPFLTERPPSLRAWIELVGLMVTPIVVMLIWRRLWVHRLLLTFMILDALRWLVFG
jgi:hypothetical protein